MRALALCSLLLIAASLQAQPVVGGLAPSVGFGVQADLTNANFPGPNINGSNALKDVYGAGFGGGIHLDVAFAMLSLRLSGDYLKFSPDNSKYQQALASVIGTAANQFSVSGGGISMISGNLNAKMSILPLPIVKPYLTGGIGLARLSVDDASIMQNGAASTLQIPGFSSGTQASFNIGAGVDLSIGVTLFLEAKYTWVMTDPNTSTLIPVQIGITF